MENLGHTLTSKQSNTFTLGLITSAITSSAGVKPCDNMSITRNIVNKYEWKTSNKK